MVQVNIANRELSGILLNNSDFSTFAKYCSRKRPNVLADFIDAVNSEREDEHLFALLAKTQPNGEPVIHWLLNRENMHDSPAYYSTFLETIFSGPTLLRVKAQNGFTSLNLLAQYHPKLFASSWKALTSSPELDKTKLTQEVQGSILLHYVARYSPENFKTTWESLDTSNSSELIFQVKDSGWNLLHYVANYCPEYFPDLFLLLNEEQRYRAANLPTLEQEAYVVHLLSTNCSSFQLPDYITAGFSLLLPYCSQKALSHKAKFKDGNTKTPFETFGYASPLVKEKTTLKFFLNPNFSTRELTTEQLLNTIRYYPALMICCFSQLIDKIRIEAKNYPGQVLHYFFSELLRTHYESSDFMSIIVQAVQSYIRSKPEGDNSLGKFTKELLIFILTPTSDFQPDIIKAKVKSLYEQRAQEHSLLNVNWAFNPNRMLQYSRIAAEDALFKSAYEACGYKVEAPGVLNRVSKIFSW